MKAIYGMDKNSVWWVASDLGWVVGLSYICYGPLLYGATSVMYEGKPDRTPDAGQYFRSEISFSLFTNFSIDTNFALERKDRYRISHSREFV